MDKMKKDVVYSQQEIAKQLEKIEKKISNKEEILKRDTKTMLRNELTAKIENYYTTYYNTRETLELARAKTSLQLIERQNRIINEIGSNTLEKDYLQSIFNNINNKTYKKLYDNNIAYYTTTEEGRAIVQQRQQLIKNETDELRRKIEKAQSPSLFDWLSTIINAISLFFK